MSASSDQDRAAPELPGYRFLRHLGSGGYSQVYLYEQQMPRRNVAIKVISSTGLTDETRGQFTAEADAMAGLADHPNIVQVFDAAIAGDGRPYLVMQYCPQPNLSVRARREHFTVAEVLRIGIQIGSAVETAHRNEILHRDIKPHNVLTGQFGTRPSPISASRPGRAPKAAAREAFRCPGHRLRWCTALPTATSAPTCTRSGRRSGTCSSGTRRSSSLAATTAPWR